MILRVIILPDDNNNNNNQPLPLFSNKQIKTIIRIGSKMEETIVEVSVTSLEAIQGVFGVQLLKKIRRVANKKSSN